MKHNPTELATSSKATNMSAGQDIHTIARNVKAVRYFRLPLRYRRGLRSPALVRS